MKTCVLREAKQKHLSHAFTNEESYCKFNVVFVSGHQILKVGSNECSPSF